MVASDNAFDTADRDAFDAAFPWFDHSRWGWAYEPVRSSPCEPYRLRDAGPGAGGSIETYMPGATRDQCQAVEAWLRRRFNPAYDVPATRFALKFACRAPGAPESRPAGSGPFDHLFVRSRKT